MSCRKPPKFLLGYEQFLTCPVCKQVLKDAVSTRCGHTFCESCIDTWLQKGCYSCPECRALVMRMQLRPVFALRSLADSLVSRSEEDRRICSAVIKLGRTKSMEDCSGAATVASPEPSGAEGKPTGASNSSEALRDMWASLNRLDSEISSVQGVIDRNRRSNLALETSLMQLKSTLIKRRASNPLLLA